MLVPIPNLDTKSLKRRTIPSYPTRIIRALSPNITVIPAEDQQTPDNEAVADSPSHQGSSSIPTSSRVPEKPPVWLADLLATLIPPGQKRRRSPSVSSSASSESRDMCSSPDEEVSENINPVVGSLWNCPASDPELEDPGIVPTFNFSDFSKVLLMARGQREAVKTTPESEKNHQCPWNLSQEIGDFAFKTAKTAQENGPRAIFPSSNSIDLERLAVHDSRHPESSEFFRPIKLGQKVKTHIRSAPSDASLNTLDIKTDAQTRGSAGASLVLLDILTMLLDSVENSMTEERTKNKMKAFRSFALSIGRQVSVAAIYRAVRHRERLRSSIMPSKLNWEHSELMDSPMTENSLFGSRSVSEVSTP